MPDFTLHKQLEADSLFIRDLKLSQLRLNNQKAVPWLILIPRRPDAREIHQLHAKDRAVLMEEIAQASNAIEALYRPDKINIGALGNIVPQLHVHIIGRFRNDPAWPGPAWGKLKASPYPPDGLGEIKARFDAAGFWAS